MPARRPASHPLVLPAHEKRVLVMLGAWLCAEYIFVLVLTSTSLARLVGIPVIFPAQANALPLLLPLLLAGFFFVLERGRFGPESMGRPSPYQRAVAATLLGISLAVAFLLTHPTDAQLYSLQLLVEPSPLTGWTIVMAALRLVLFLPAIPLFILLFPAAFLRTFALPLLLMLLTMIGALLSGILDVLFYATTVPLILQGSVVLLQLFGLSGVTFDAQKRLVELGEYSAYIGPVCAGFTLLLLFCGFYALLIGRIRLRKTFSAPRALLGFGAGLILLFLLNVARIAVIVVIGARSPVLATELFHGVAGTLLIFLVWMGFLRIASGWIAPGEGP